MDRLILASSSPRRADILSSLGFSFEILATHANEDFAGLDAEEAVRELALRKLRAAIDLMSVETGVSETADGRIRVSEGAWILAADTLVWKGDRVFGKARGREDARLMLSALSGSRHLVSTGLALHSPGGKVSSGAFTTEVMFKELSTAEIDWYLSTGEWEGVAGAYRIQGKAGFFIREIKGEYHTVVGLPISGLYDMLRASGFRL